MSLPHRTLVLLALVATLLPPADAHPQDQEAATQPIVVEFGFEGLRSDDPDAVQRTLGIVVGEPWPALVRQRAGIKRVFDTYGVIVLQPRLEAVPGGVKVTVPVSELPVDLEPRFVGNDRIPVSKLREWALLDQREQIYVHEAYNVRQRLLRGYRRQGFHFAEVDVVTGGAAPEAGEEQAEGGVSAASDVIFEIREGPKVRCTKVTVRGNQDLPDTGWGLWRGGLRSLARVDTKGRGLLRWWGKVFDREVLEADLLAMRQVFRDRGWLDVTVEVEELKFSDDRDRVHVHVVVDQGELYRVSSVSIEAYEREWDPTSRNWVEERAELLFPEEELLALLEMQPGNPLEQARVAHDTGALGRYYGERGYIPQDFFDDPLAGGWKWLEPIFIRDYERREVQVVYRFAQGRQRSYREIRLVGHGHTRDAVLRRELSALPGKRANLAEIQRGRERLSGTGYFDDTLDPRHPPPDVRLEVADDDPDKIDVIYEVTEGRVVDFNIAGGVASDSGILGILSLSMRNASVANLPSSMASTFIEVYRKEAFHGNGETLLMDVSPGSQISYYRFLYAHPDIFTTHFNRWTARGMFENRLRRFRSHDEKRTQAEAILGHLFGQGDLSLSVGPVYQEVELDSLDDEVPWSLARSEGVTEFQGLEAHLRYRNLDNPRQPRRGVLARWLNTVYGGGLGGDENLVKSEVQVDLYTPLGSPDADIRSGFYFSAGLGVAHPFDDTDEAHYSERFFLGGSSTLRGFDFRGVGPNDRGFAIGGETYLRGTIEYRHPLYSVPIPGTSRRQEMVRGFLFVDAGVLDPESFELELDELRSSVGFGFALTQPIPLKFNFGFPIEKGDGDDTETFSFRLDWR